MLGGINVINVEALAKALNDVECGRLHIAPLERKDFELRQFTTQPPPDFILPDEFPNCCEKHKRVYEIGLAKYSKFPHCCANHKKLIGQHWFIKESYSYLPLKLVTTSTYTLHCIAKFIDSENWFKEITDYIDYTKNSFGQFPEGLGPPLGLEVYLHSLERNFQEESQMPAAKKARLLNFIREYEMPKEVNNTDINLLIGRYKEWLKIFPFEISYFRHLRPYFENQIPILKGKGETNLYTGLTGFKLLSKNEVINFLCKTTLSILKEINSLTLYENGELNDVTATQIQLLTARRRIEIEELDLKESSDGRRYIKVLKKWLKDEKLFLKELKPLLQKKFVFINDLLDGMRLLQQKGTNEPCIVNLRNDGPNKETSFRYWFKNFFIARYPAGTVTAEEERGNGRIDLKISHKSFGDKLVEFKGWWNQDKKTVPQQICSYLTDFEKDGYIFIINHLEHKAIVENYKSLITHPSTNFVQESWKEHNGANTRFSYYETRHKFHAQEKAVYHFIFNVNF